MVDGRDRILPDQLFFRHFRSEVTGARAHVAVRQFEPGARECVGERLRVLVETARNLLIGGIEAQGEIRGRHHRRVFLVRVVRVGDHVFRLAVLRHPLVRAGRTLGEFPFVAEQHIEIAVVPFRRVRFPRAFDTAGGGMNALARTECVDPAQALGFDRCGFGFRSDQFRIAGTVCFTEGVTTSDQCDGFLIVHRHATEGLAYVATGGDRIGFSVGAFRVHVDEPHLYRGQRLSSLRSPE